MKLDNTDLILSRKELIDMIEKDNPEKNDWSKENLISMIKCFRSFSDKQYKWILSKVNFIINHNNKYKIFKKKFKNLKIENY